MTYEAYLKTLKKFHSKTEEILEHQSLLAGDAFPGEFNVSGYHKEILSLPENPRALWGIDRCLRIRDFADDFHSRIFHMGIYAKSVDLKKDFIEPSKDPRLALFQEEIVGQFIDLLVSLGVPLEEVEATVAGQVVVGGVPNGRDSRLARAYTLGPDSVLKELLKTKGIRIATVPGLANVDIHPTGEALVGLRCEVAYRGVEIATVVFNTFRIVDQHLEPINYVGGYALGIERIYALMHQGTIASSVPRHMRATEILLKGKPYLTSPLLKQSFLEILFGLEVQALLPALETGSHGYSTHQEQHLRRHNTSLAVAAHELGIGELLMQAVRESYANA